MCDSPVAWNGHVLITPEVWEVWKYEDVIVLCVTAASVQQMHVPFTWFPHFGAE